IPERLSGRLPLSGVEPAVLVGVELVDDLPLLVTRTDSTAAAAGTGLGRHIRSDGREERDEKRRSDVLKAECCHGALILNPQDQQRRRKGGSGLYPLYNCHPHWRAVASVSSSPVRATQPAATSIWAIV